ncbi:MAG: MarR family winged helix-turn-helix transcriptional regulator [Pseudomonadota bacterium]
MSDEPDPYDSLGRAIGLAQRRWTALFNEQMAAMGQTHLRWMALSRISEFSDGINQRDLSRLLGVDEPSLARIIAALEAQGLVKRRRAANDRRAKILQITPAAEAVHREGARIGRKLQTRAFGDLPEADLAAALRVLTHAGERLAPKD